MVLVRNLFFSSTILILFCMAPIFSQSKKPTCDREALQKGKLEFRQLQNQRARDSDTVSEKAFRTASRDYIRLAELCYAEEFGEIEKFKMDEGGLWVPGYGPSRRHNLFGTKWGAGSPYFATFGDHPDAEGPRIPGGTVTFSYMADGVDLSQELGEAAANTALSSMSSFDDCFFSEIEDAFAAWAAVADISFVPTSDNGVPADAPGATGMIRIGAHEMDGPGGAIAHAYYPPPNGISLAGDLHFDTEENWTCDPGSGSIDIGIVALHEIGHALGLGHETTDPAIMEPYYNPAVASTLLADDIVGIVEIYGPNPLTGRPNPPTALRVVIQTGN